MPPRSSQTKSGTLRTTIAERAYAIWESEGRRHGADMEHWLKAEAEIGATAADAKGERVQKPAQGKRAKPAAKQLRSK